MDPRPNDPATTPAGPASTGPTPPGPRPTARPLERVELLSIGTEVTVGETVDTNAGELARSLVGAGLSVTRIVALPDDLDVVAGAFRDALGRADLVVSTGGLGPTPDDLTREAIAAVLGETPSVDPDLETWLRNLFRRRRVPFPEPNLKQAWRIPSATSLPNPNGTAPGWWVDAPGGRAIVALPGPPREMRPMWRETVLPLVLARVTRARVTRSYRLVGIGESHVAERLGRELLLGSNPTVATYARADAVDVRISAVDETPDAGTSLGRSAAELVAAAEARVLAELGDHVWGRDDDTWADAVGMALDGRGWDLALLEIGTGGGLAALLADTVRLVHAATWRALADTGHSTTADVVALADEVRMRAGAAVGCAVVATERDHDTDVTIGVVTPTTSRRETRLAFLRGAQGRHRAAVLAAAILRETVSA